MKYRNPVLPGFYPDPSVCRVGEDYYLVNSSFEFFPGVPLWHSKDLVNWEQIGHVLTRKSQLPLAGCRTSGGIFAPTIRYHNGRFYMITTNITGLGNFFVWTDDVRGEWSEPILIDHMGIDPSLFWDDDGRVYYQGTGFGELGQGIVQFELDIETGKILSEKKIIWSGTGGKCPEGPHMYKIDGRYYLMIAEGGTEYGHMETIARADNVWGPFESCSHNPIVTNRNASPVYGAEGPASEDIQGVGHADLVEDVHGGWWLVFHGIRPSQAMLHHIGRETMTAPVEWKDGWPVVNGGRPITDEMEVPALADGSTGSAAVQPDFAFEEDFTAETALPSRWAYLREPHLENVVLSGAGLTLTSGGDDLDSFGAVTFVGARQRHFNVTAETVMDGPTGGEAGLSVFHTNEHHYDLLVRRENGGRQAVLRKRVCDMVTETPAVPLPESGRVRLMIRSDRLHYEFYAGPEGGELVKVGEGLSQLLSTEMMKSTFTGCFFGMVCQGEQGAKAVFERFNYQL